ncbi:MAG: large-conductance mechanosensitive channel protein MscL [Clostridia bacterium]|nr:large-conductance mechanosensitive channel protein MscL [Clostridia bacterium]
MLKEFKDFALKGNVIDLAVAVIIGGAFGKIVASLVNDIIMPVVSVLISGMSFTDLKFVVGDVAITYGNFIQNIVDFLIIAFSIFLAIKLINKSKKKEAVSEEPAKPTEAELLTEIRDLLKENK